VSPTTTSRSATSRHLRPRRRLAERVDHVDGHRNPTLVISPYAARGKVHQPCPGDKKVLLPDQLPGAHAAPVADDDG
jgi:hypothetical protein